MDCAEEAFALWQQIAVPDRAYLPEYARALLQLGIAYGGVDLRGAALTPSWRAVKLLRGLADYNRVHRPAFACALAQLGVAYAAAGVRGRAVERLEKAVQRLRRLADENSAQLPHLARALAQLGVAYAGEDRAEEGIERIENAVALWRDLVAESPGREPELARALIQLGTAYGGADRPAAAVAQLEEAVARYRPAAVGNPAHLPALAVALHRLEEVSEPAYAERVSTLWAETLSNQPSESYREFLGSRRGGSDRSAAAVAVDAVITGIDLFGADDEVLLADRGVLRRRREARPATFDATAQGKQLLSRWVHADTHERQCMLADRETRARLVGPSFEQVLPKLGKAHASDPAFPVASWLLRLARLRRDAAAFSAVEHPRRMPHLLTSLIRSDEVEAHQAMAWCAAHHALVKPSPGRPLRPTASGRDTATARVPSVCQLHLAIALILAGDTDRAVRLIENGNGRELSDWLALLGELTALHPQLAALERAIAEQHSASSRA